MSNESWLPKLKAWMSESSGAPMPLPAPEAPPAEIVAIAPEPIHVPEPVPITMVEPAPAEPEAFYAPPNYTSQVAAVVNMQTFSGKSFPPAPTTRRQQHVISDEMPDLGVLNTLMADPSVGDILVNGTNSIYIDKGGKLVDSGLRFATHDEVWDVAERIVKSVGQQLSYDRPMIDTRLPDGSRVNIVAPPMAVDGVTISIRKFPVKQITLEHMVSGGQMTPELAEFLSLCVRDRANIIISGGTGSGKTTLLNALSASISPDERLVTIEDSAELKLQQPHVVRLEAKVAMTADKAHQAVSVRDLVRNALRMRPDRIIVGESRGPEALDVLQAMNTGHDGSMTTLHANTPRDALSRLETMVAMAMPQLPVRLVRQQISSTVHLIIHMTRCKDGVRRVTQVTEVAGMEGEIITMQDLITYTEATTDRHGHFRWANGSPRDPILADAARNSGIMRGVR